MQDELYEQLVKKRPYLWWWVKDKDALSIESIVEGVLAYGDMEDALKLFEIVGRENVKIIFLKQASGRRHNYRPQTVNFFKKVFSRNA